MTTLRAFLAFTICLLCLPAVAQPDYPNRPIRIIVPYAAGGGGDVMARAVGKKMAETLGQAVVVENRAGASGMIGTSVVARAKDDPYTLLLGSSAEMAINPSLYESINYDSERDFTPIAFVGKLPLVLVTNPETEADSLHDLIEVAKVSPHAVAFASAGVGQLAHLGVESIARAAGVEMMHIPYKGGSEAVVAVMTNQAQLFLAGLPPALPQIAAGKLVPLAVSTAARVPQLSAVPTVAESGLAGFDLFNWFALFGPAGVSPEVVDKLHAAVREAVESPEVRKVWEEQGILAQDMSPAQLRQFVAHETDRYRELVRAANITVD